MREIIKGDLGYRSDSVTAFRAIKSPQDLQVPFFFFTRRRRLDHELFNGRQMPCLAYTRIQLLQFLNHQVIVYEFYKRSGVPFATIE
ncbi:hypothetical protein CEXT_380981 [Caerostris extrusa]|uniref:Uncharacterized protein n=1 Tax=Caerostris extrusa TaxID=172846 RepID=A0AAV4NC25_CAEEX|nr:hypothetical protein CEXT_380981 [Caerostris extrusa]